MNRRTFLKSAGAALALGAVGGKVMQSTDAALDGAQTWFSICNMTWGDLEAFDIGDESTTLFWGTDPPDGPIKRPGMDYVRGYSFRVEEDCLTLQHGDWKYWYDSLEARKVFEGDEWVYTAVTRDGDEFALLLNSKLQTPTRQEKIV